MARASRKWDGPRVPPAAADGTRLNCCRNPLCDNYAIPPISDRKDGVSSQSSRHCRSRTSGASDSVLGGRKAAERVMGSGLFVVDHPPVRGRRPPAFSSGAI